MRVYLRKMPISLAVLLCLSLPTYAEKPDDASLMIMLQGTDVAELRQLVEGVGGTVTHDLPIIQALGAAVTTAQLEQIRSSPMILRLIDDLSMDMSEPLPPPDTARCTLGGALEARVSDSVLEWDIHNLGAVAERLTHVQLSWPEALGPEPQIRLGEMPLKLPPPAQESDGTWHTSDEISGGRPAPLPGGVATFAMTFPQQAGEAPGGWQQHHFSVTLQFGKECKLEMIPGYTDYMSDTYFPSVSGAAELHRHGVTGRGVTVAVLDSGLWEHAALAKDTLGENRIAGRYDAIRDLADHPVPDASGHGTHMSSVIAHSERVLTNGQPDGSYKGIAPDARLVAIKAFDEEGQGDFLDIVRGIQWAVDNRERLDIRVLNLSFAARPRWPYFLDPINQALMRAWAAGITIVAAAGNEGPAPMTIGSPGNLPYIITVGAYTDSWTVDDRNDDYIPGFSSRGPTPSGHIKPDIVAPGGHIAGLAEPGSALTKKHPNYMISTGELVMTGTSQASALVSGIAALLLQLEPNLSPDDIKCKLMSSAEPAIHRNGRLYYSPFQQGSGAVSATRAITLGISGCGNAGLDLARDISGEMHFEGPAVVDDTGQPTLPGIERMLASDATEDSPSSALRWGVKAHIEREDALPPEEDLPINWLEIYFSEKEKIEELSRNADLNPVH
jgi:hypothetical protein